MVQVGTFKDESKVVPVSKDTFIEDEGNLELNLVPMGNQRTANIVV